MAFIGRKPTNAPLTSDDIPNGIIGAADLASGISGLITWQSVQTTGFTAVAGRGYPCNTTSAAFTVTLPASPSVGDTIILLDYAGTFDTNALTISPNGNKIEGGTDNLSLSGEREGALLVYIDSTQGWLATSGINEGTDALSLAPYSADYLVVAGGGSGSANLGGAGGAGGLLSGTTNISIGTVYTITVGGGGTSDGLSGSNSSISGTGLTTITSIGGGGGGSITPTNGASGGSGGGGGSNYFSGSPPTGGSGTSGQGNAGGSGAGGGTQTVATAAGGGGGGSSAVGSNAVSSTGGAGGNGTASSITGSSVTYAGGGGGGSGTNTSSGGTGGGGAGGGGGTVGVNGTANTGGGGGGGGNPGTANGNGGSGVVILSVPTAKYSATSTGSPTITTSGSNTILKFTGSGTYTG